MKKFLFVTPSELVICSLNAKNMDEAFDKYNLLHRENPDFYVSPVMVYCVSSIKFFG